MVAHMSLKFQYIPSRQCYFHAGIRRSPMLWALMHSHDIVDAGFVLYAVYLKKSSGHTLTLCFSPSDISSGTKNSVTASLSSSVQVAFLDCVQFA